MSERAISPTDQSSPHEMVEGGGRPAGEAFDAVVIGAGPGGLGVAALLAGTSMRSVVLERGSGPGAKWRAGYDRLHVNTSTLSSFLPGRRFPLSYGRWPSRDELVAYYEDYALEHELDIRTYTDARRIDRSDQGWIVDAGDKEFIAPVVVIATSKDRTPVIPDWPGRGSFAGVLLHSARYQSSMRFKDKDVLVVGVGNSALDICLDLVEGGAASVRLSVRTPPHVVRRSVLGIPNDVFAIASHRLPVPVIDTLARTLRRFSIGDLSEHGLPIPDDGLASRLTGRGMIPTIDPGAFIPAIKAGRIRVVAGVDALERHSVKLEDGSTLAVDAVVAATGYRRDLEPLVGHLGVLDAEGQPLTGRSNASPRAPGMYFIGFSNVLAGNLRQMRLDARAIAKAIARDRDDPTARTPRALRNTKS